MSGPLHSSIALALLGRADLAKPYHLITIKHKSACSTSAVVVYVCLMFFGHLIYLSCASIYFWLVLDFLTL
jgi:hypothetical protein